MAEDNNQILDQVTQSEYKYGFYTDIEMDQAPKGLTEDTIRFISAKKNEPDFMLEFRLKAFRHWQTLKEPKWAKVSYPDIDFQDIIYYSAPKKKAEYESLDQIDPELLATFEKLGISLEEQKRLTGVAVDVVMDSVSVGTSFKEALKEKNIIFCSFSEALQKYPDLVKKYIGTVVPHTDNFYAALNSEIGRAHV